MAVVSRIVKQICDDLAAEQAALDAVVADLSEDQWSQPTPAEGWDVTATIAHLVQADLAALMAVRDPDAFNVAKAGLNAGTARFETVFGAPPDSSGAGTLQWWRSSRAAMLDAFRSREPKDRIPWFGPSMSTISFATARLMETWAHGQDVATTLGKRIPATDRLRHVCHIGVTTRGWSYVNRGLAVPEAPVRVELIGPSGAVWTWGEQDAAQSVTGDAIDFCLVVTQRATVQETALRCVGDVAADWMRRAQAFAGGPTDTDPQRAGVAG